MVYPDFQHVTKWRDKTKGKIDGCQGGHKRERSTNVVEPSHLIPALAMIIDIQSDVEMIFHAIMHHKDIELLFYCIYPESEQ